MKKHLAEAQAEWKKDFNTVLQCCKDNHTDIKEVISEGQVERKVLNAIAISLRAQNVPKKVHGLRPQTRAQLSTLDFYLDSGLMIKVGTTYHCQVCCRPGMRTGTHNGSTA